ncbi:MAG: putative 4-mercaptohistidine N1-methyltransferase [Verrucomicrobiaceae bacterium]|nr:MAG: putative 4-mercaptohistidine N1-methyltransferase [Verrucomicrobiaceae bacterium]
MPNLYETRRLLDEYLLFHYGSSQDSLPWPEGPQAALHFPVRSVTELRPEEGREFARALDIGCAVGRSSFELSKFCQEVTGIDFSHSFVNAAEEMRTAGPLSYQVAEEGRFTSTRTAALPDGAHPGRVRFLQGDAMNLPDDLGTFDLVHAANLVCRLTEPRRFLDRLPALVKPGGFLLLTTPCTWLEEFTLPENMPAVRTFDWLQHLLSPAFTLRRRVDLPFLIREHARKFQWSVALGTLWERRV